MTDEQITKGLDQLIRNNRCLLEDEDGNDCNGCPLENVFICNATVVMYLQNLAKSETQLRELLSALYRKTEEPFTLYRKDIVELAKDYGIKEEELK